MQIVHLVAAATCRLFRDGTVSWGRIVTLLCFGYRIAVTVIQRGIRGFFSRIVSFVVKFIVSEKIAKWIADQGGWVTELIYISNFFLYDSNFYVRCCDSEIY